jgi:hypothetical protein
MKSIFVLAIAALAIIKNNCNKNSKAGCYKGKLEIKGICSNYTIKLLEGSLDSTLFSTNWTDDQTGKVYTNVFALGSPCTFPDTLNQGDEFYFTIDTSKQDCNVCMAYYPTPGKKLAIKVIPQCK